MNKGKQLDYSGKNIYIGLDTHLKSWKTTIRVGDTFFKTFSQDPEAVVLSPYKGRIRKSRDSYGMTNWV